MHRVYPGGAEWLYAVDDLPHGCLVREYPNGAIQAKHLRGQVLRNNRRLIAGLNKQTGRKQALCRFLEHHHRVPVMDMRRLHEAQPMPPELEPVAIAHPLHRALIVPVSEIDARTQFTCHQHRVRRLGKKPVHSAALIRLEVAEHDIGKPLGIEHLCDCGPYRLIRVIKAGVDQRRAFVIDQELVEPNGIFARWHRAKAINFANNLADLGHCKLPRFSCT